MLFFFFFPISKCEALLKKGGTRITELQHRLLKPAWDVIKYIFLTFPGFSWPVNLFWLLFSILRGTEESRAWWVTGVATICKHLLSTYYGPITLSGPGNIQNGQARGNHCNLCATSHNLVVYFLLCLCSATEGRPARRVVSWSSLYPKYVARLNQHFLKDRVSVGGVTWKRKYWMFWPK